MEEERFFLYDEKEKSDTRFVSFMGETHRHDLALVKTSRYYGKTLVLDIQGTRFAIIGHDDLFQAESKVMQDRPPDDVRFISDNRYTPYARSFDSAMLPPGALRRQRKHRRGYAGHTGFRS